MTVRMTRGRGSGRDHRTGHIGPTTLFYFLVTSISRRDTFRGMIQINLVGYRDLTI